MILGLVFAWMGYQKATASDRNGWLWGFLALSAYIGTQVVIQLTIGIVIGIGIETLGWSNDLFEGGYNILFTVISIIPSCLAGYAVLKYLDRSAQSEAFEKFDVPPPPTFN